MFLVSGGSDGSDYLDSTEIFDPSLGSWRAGAALPSPRSDLRATNIDNRVLLFSYDILLTFYIGDDNSVQSLIILAGGKEKDGLYTTKLDTILEYNITGDSYTQIGTMIQARADHAISVVKYEDFSEWCQ